MPDQHGAAPRIRRVVGAALVVLVLVLPLAQLLNIPAIETAAAQAALPPLPARWPSTMQLGQADSPGGAAAMRSVTSFGFRYQYLSGGATGGGWATWNANGDFARYYIQDSIAAGIVPVFTYYNIYQSAPGATGGESSAVYANLQNRSTMTAYYNDLKLLFQRAGAFPNNLVVVHVEPDMWGYLQTRARNDDASTVPVQVAATGVPELAGLPNNASGLARAIVELRDTYAPNVSLGYHLSVWGTGNDIIYSNPPNATVQSLATRAGNYYRSLEADFDVVFAEFTDRDAGFKQYQYGDGGASWWDAGDFSRNQLFLSTFVGVAHKRVVVWQIPYGNTKMRAMNNTWGHYQDNHVEYLLDDPGRAHLEAYRQAGVIAFLFGGGAGGVTCPCDGVRDGVTNPAPINGNTLMSLNADDDGGFFKQKASAYYAGGALGLSGGSTPPTSTPAATATATRTPTPQAPPTQAPLPPTPVPSDLLVAFNDLPNAGRALDGQYPSGVIDWGSGQWYLSRPWQSLNTNSVSFANGSLRSASLRFVSPRQLVSVLAYNGGSGASTVTLSCAGQPTRQVTLAARSTQTLTTGWSGACSTVTVASTNGWDTNFDQLVIR